MSTVTIGVDLAKQVLSVCEVDATGRILKRLTLKRNVFSAWLAHRPAGSVVAMEACSCAHHRARRCLEYGLASRLMLTAVTQMDADFVFHRNAVKPGTCLAQDGSGRSVANAARVDRADRSVACEAVPAEAGVRFLKALARVERFTVVRSSRLSSDGFRTLRP